MTFLQLRSWTLFKRVSLKKAMGPFLLKTCAEELTPAWRLFFQQSITIQRVPTLWKSSFVIPIPKKANQTENNDFRPVALTSLVMNDLDKCVMSMLKEDVNSKLDSLQFT